MSERAIEQKSSRFVEIMPALAAASGPTAQPQFGNSFVQTMAQFHERLGQRAGAFQKVAENAMKRSSELNDAAAPATCAPTRTAAATARRGPSFGPAPGA